MEKQLEQLIKFGETRGLVFSALLKRKEGWSVEWYDGKRDVLSNFTSGLFRRGPYDSASDAIKAERFRIGTMAERTLASDAYRP